MADNLTLIVGADITDLTAKLAIAQASFRSSAAELRTSAAAYRDAGDEAKGAYLPAVQAAAAATAACKAQVAAINAELRETTGAAHGAASAMVVLRESTEGIHASIRETTSLFSAMGELFLVGFGIERIAEFALKSAELGEEMIKTAQKTGIAVEALSELRFAAETSGVKFDALQVGLRGLATSMSEALANPMSKAALAFRQLGIDSTFLRANENDLQAVLYKVADAYAATADGAIKEANAKDLMKRGGIELIPVLDQGSAGLEKMAAKARELNAVMSTETAEHLEEIKQKATALNLAWANFAANITALIAPALTVLIDKINGVFAAANRGTLKTLQDEAAALTKMIERQEGDIATYKFFGGGDYELARLDQMRARLAEIRADIKDIQNIRPPADEKKPPPPGIEVPDKPPTELELFRARLATMQADWVGTHRDMLTATITMWQDELATATLTARERVATEKGVADARRALNKFVHDEDQAITRSDSDTEIQISKLAITTKKAELDAELAAHRITAEQKLETLRTLASQEYDLDLKALEAEKATLDEGTLAYEKVFNQIRLLKARLNADLATFDRQYVVSAKQAATDSAKVWKDAFGEITSASSSMISQLLAGQTTFAQAALNVGAQLVEHEIANDAKYLLAHLFYSSAELAADKSIATGGILTHLLAEQTKTAATAAGATARGATGIAENAGFFSRVGTAIAEWLGLETGKTAATTTGAAARAAADVISANAQAATTAAAATAEVAVVTAKSIAEIKAAAAVAAATAYAPWAWNPPVAAGVAAEAFATVSAFGAALVVPAAAGGWDLPASAGGIPMIGHSREMMLPEKYADVIRGMAASGGGAGGGHTFNTHVHVTQTDPDPQMIVAAVAEAHRNFSPALRRAMR